MTGDLELCRTTMAKGSTQKREGVQRLTLDLSQDVRDRLSKLEGQVNLVGKANVIRQALQLYENIVDLTLRGYRFKRVSESGEEQEIVFLGLPTNPGNHNSGSGSVRR